METTDSPIHKTRAKVREALEKYYGPPSAFRDFFTEIDNDLCGFYSDQINPAEVPLLGECFIPEELNAIIRMALKGRGSPLRSALSNNGFTFGDPQEFAESLSVAEKVQTLMLLDSQELSSSIDEAVNAKDIKIPDHEIRRPKILDISAGHYNLSAECSRYGVRSLPGDISLAMVRLHRLISSIYKLSDAPDRRDLEWRLRRIEGNTTEDRLDRFVRNEDPIEVLRQLVLVGPTQTAFAANQCGVPTSRELERLEDSEILNILLWKLGFNITSTDQTFGPLRRNHEMFAQAVADTAAYSETERYEIKRESAPLFSSIESALDATLAFASWALTFDHWSAKRQFTYYPADARVQMASVLNSGPARRASSAAKPIIYDQQGRNTLFPLISGFARLKAYLSNMLTEGDQYRRSEFNMPPYAKAVELTPFAFNYRAPFLDLGSGAQQRIINLLSDITKLLEAGQVSSVRNRLQHSRDDFPTKEELMQFLDSVSRFIALTEESGICPVVFSHVGNCRDSSGRASYCFKDYRGREYIARRPSGVASPGMPALTRDQFIMPVAVLKESGEVLRFSIGTHSTYDEMWADWPKYRAPVDDATGLLRSIDDAAQAG